MCLMTQRVFVDANVLSSPTLCSWLFMLQLNTEGMFQTHTSQDVIVEAGNALRNQKPEAPGKLIDDFLTRVGRYTEIVAGYPGGKVHWIEDPGDWHVHHAASHSGADYLLTNDSGLSGSDETNYEVYTCDEFFMLINDSAPLATYAVVLDQASYWARKNGKQLPEVLRGAACPEFADVVRAHLQRAARTSRDLR